MTWSRRRLLHGAFLTLGGASAGAAATEARLPFLGERLPLDGGYAPAGNASGVSARGGLRTFWHVPTTKPWVALTFDDGPLPQWTPRVLETLERLEAPATFFVVGDRLLRHESMVRGRYARHEVGNHTWSHVDLAKRGAAAVRDQVGRCHDAIMQVIGKTPKLLRPPWGHLGGTTLTVADEFGYDVAMWSYVMPERRFAGQPAALAAEVAGAVRPGSILLAHDVGRPSRLALIDGLADMIRRLRDRGLELVTVSQLLTAGALA